MIKIIKLIIVLAAVFFVLTFPNYAVDSESPFLYNGDLNDYTEEEGLLFNTYYITGWNSDDGAVVNSSDKSNFCFTVIGERAVIFYQYEVSLPKGSYFFGVSLKTSEEASVRFLLGDNYVSELVGVGDTGGEFKKIGTVMSVLSGSYSFSMEIVNGGVCYVDDVVITEFVSPPTESECLTIERGAYLRVNSEHPGLRFCGRVDKNYYDFYKSEYEGAEVGIIIVPYDYLSDCAYFTVAELSSHGLNYQEIAANIWNNNPDSDGYYGFNCALVDIYPFNVDRAFAARTYMKYIEDGSVKYVYGAFDASENVRSVCGVANAAKNSDYDSFNSVQKEVIDYFCNAVETVVVSAYDNTGFGEYTYYFNSESEGYAVISYSLSENVSLTTIRAESGGDSKVVTFNAFEVGKGAAGITFCLNENPLTSPILDLTIKIYKNYK